MYRKLEQGAVEDGVFGYGRIISPWLQYRYLYPELLLEQHGKGAGLYEGGVAEDVVW